MNTIQHVGFIGLGRMGQAIVPRLLGGGFSVTVWNRTASRCEPVIAAGAPLPATPAPLLRKNGHEFTRLHYFANRPEQQDRHPPIAERRRFLEMITMRTNGHANT